MCAGQSPSVWLWTTAVIAPPHSNGPPESPWSATPETMWTAVVVVSADSTLSVHERLVSNVTVPLDSSCAPNPTPVQVVPTAGSGPLGTGPGLSGSGAMSLIGVARWASNRSLLGCEIC